MDTKFCLCCSEEKPIDAFPLKRGKPNTNCKICWNKRNRIYRETNPEKTSKRHSDYWKKVKGTEQQRERDTQKCKRYRETHLDVFRFHTAKYRSKKLQATPAWVDMDAIHSIYLNCPAGYHVDHIIPLQGKYVSGLHVHTNLQYLPAIENIQKANSFQI